MDEATEASTAKPTPRTDAALKAVEADLQDAVLLLRQGLDYETTGRHGPYKTAAASSVLPRSPMTASRARRPRVRAAATP